MHERLVPGIPEEISDVVKSGGNAAAQLESSGREAEKVGQVKVQAVPCAVLDQFAVEKDRPHEKLFEQLFVFLVARRHAFPIVFGEITRDVRQIVGAFVVGPGGRRPVKQRRELACVQITSVLLQDAFFSARR